MKLSLLFVSFPATSMKLGLLFDDAAPPAA
jgi:hypothetical protein